MNKINNTNNNLVFFIQTNSKIQKNFAKISMLTESNKIQ